MAGENKTTFQAHAALLCKSDKLKAGIEGDWADKDRIVLPDWDEETVSRLLEWLCKYSPLSILLLVLPDESPNKQDDFSRLSTLHECFLISESEKRTAEPEDQF